MNDRRISCFNLDEFPVRPVVKEMLKNYTRVKVNIINTGCSYDIQTDREAKILLCDKDLEIQSYSIDEKSSCVVLNCKEER